jgi:hypothetical protein
MFEDTPLIQAVFTYICYAVLNVFGWLRDFMRQTGVERRKGAADNNSSVSEMIIIRKAEPISQLMTEN